MRCSGRLNNILDQRKDFFLKSFSDNLNNPEENIMFSIPIGYNPSIPNTTNVSNRLGIGVFPAKALKAGLTPVSLFFTYLSQVKSKNKAVSDRDIIQRKRIAELSFEIVQRIVFIRHTNYMKYTGVSKFANKKSVSIDKEQT